MELSLINVNDQMVAKFWVMDKLFNDHSVECLTIKIFFDSWRDQQPNSLIGNGIENQAFKIDQKRDSLITS